MNIDKAVSIRCAGAKTYKLDELVEFQGNLKDLSEENYNRLKREILNHGFSEPIATWENEDKIYILGGHQRYRVLKGLQAEGYFVPPIPCSTVQAKDEKEAKEKVLAFTSQYGEITDTGLYEFMNDSGIDVSFLEDLRFPEIDLDKWKESYVDDSAAVGEEDEVPEPPKTPRTKFGDLIELGEHRLLCGDSTDRAQVEKLMNNEKADLVFTDPPYGINLDTSGKMSHTSKSYEKIIGDESYFDISFILQKDSFKELWIWGANYFVDKIGLHGTWTVWDKKSDDEIDTNWDGRFGNDFEICWTNLKTKQSLVRKIVPTGYFARGDEARIHPTQKPVRLVVHYLKKLCKSKGPVIDYFGGSGSTLIACEKTKRKCFMMELDPHYVDVIISRYCKFVGTNKVRINGNEVEWDTGEIPESHEGEP